MLVLVEKYIFVKAKFSSLESLQVGNKVLN